MEAEPREPNRKRMKPDTMWIQEVSTCNKVY